VSFQHGTADSEFKSSVFLVNRSPAFIDFFNGNGSGVGIDFTQNVNLATYPNFWKHIVIATGPGSFGCFVNGSKVYGTNIDYAVFPAPYAALGRHWWAVGSSARMSATYDNVRIYSRALSSVEVSQLYAAESGLRVDLIKAVKPSFSNLTLGTNYQLQVSGDLNSWTNQGSAFTATNNSMSYPQYFDVDNWAKLFFRLQVGP